MAAIVRELTASFRLATMVPMIRSASPPPLDLVTVRLQHSCDPPKRDGLISYDASRLTKRVVAFVDTRLHSGNSRASFGPAPRDETHG